MIDQFRIRPQIVMYMKSLLRLCLSTPELLKDEKQSSLSDNCFATLNLLEFPHSYIFYNYIGELKQKVEEILNLTDLEYFYLHLVDYTNGGCMREHSHDHNEDYSFILYLNDCDDGATVLSLGEPYYVLPSEGNVLVFSSSIPHSSNYSKSKQVLVGGLKVKQMET